MSFKDDLSLVLSMFHPVKATALEGEASNLKCCLLMLYQLPSMTLVPFCKGLVRVLIQPHHRQSWRFLAFFGVYLICAPFIALLLLTAPALGRRPFGCTPAGRIIAQLATVGEAQ